VTLKADVASRRIRQFPLRRPVGLGGFQIDNNAFINGNIYANGNVLGGNGAYANRRCLGGRRHRALPRPATDHE